jgi:hypothetical protein
MGRCVKRLDEVEKWPGGDDLVAVNHQQSKVLTSRAEDLNRATTAWEIDVRERVQVDVARKNVHQRMFVAMIDSDEEAPLLPAHTPDFTKFFRSKIGGSHRRAVSRS